MSGEVMRPTPPPHQIIRNGCWLRFNVPKFLRPLVWWADEDYWAIVRKAKS
jgi:hypothetical protein